MKGLILCAGRGTRLRPLTFTSAKQLVPVGNKPIIFYSLEAMRDAGIRDVGIVVGETGEEIRQTVGDGAKWGLSVAYILQEDPRGIAHAVQVSRSFIGEEPFVLYLGDNILRDGVKALVQEFEERKPNGIILLARVRNPREFGVAEVVEGRVVSLEEKPKSPKSDLAVIGAYLFDRHVMEAVFSVKPSHRGELEITDSIDWMIRKGLNVSSHVITGWWKDTGKKDDLLEANQMVLETLEQEIEGEVCGDSEILGRVKVCAGARIVNSTVRGPSIIGEGAQVIDSYVGPFTALGENTMVRNSEVENSIMLRDSRLEDLKGRLEDSILGRGVSVSRARTRPRTYKMMLGDMSSVDVL